MNAIGLIFDFIGWGYKNPQVPYGQQISTYRVLIEILFSTKYENLDIKQAIHSSLRNFRKIYFMTLGILSEVISDQNTSYLEFPSALEITAEEIENLIIKGVIDESSLDRFLIEHLKLDVSSLIPHSDSFSIWLPDNQCLSLPISSNFLDTTLENHTQTHKKHHAYTFSGLKITPLNIPIDSIQPPIIYFGPKRNSNINITLRDSWTLSAISKEDSPKTQRCEESNEKYDNEINRKSRSVSFGGKWIPTTKTQKKSNRVHINYLLMYLKILLYIHKEHR